MKFPIVLDALTIAEDWFWNIVIIIAVVAVVAIIVGLLLRGRSSGR
jgi:flagellar biosynthesis protein FliQ